MEHGDDDSNQEDGPRTFLLRVVTEQNEEEHPGRSQNSSRATTGRIINYYLTRLRNLNENTDDVTSLERRLRRRRHTFLDEEGESADEINNPVFEEEYIDFRSYPLSLNWTEFDSVENDSYEIVDEYGYLGVYVYNAILTHLANFKTKPESFIVKIVEFYFKNLESDDSALANDNQILVTKCFPSLTVIQTLIFSQFLCKKELPLMKIILDLVGHYYQHYETFNSSVIINEFIPTSLFFYSSLSDEDYKDMINKFIRMKGITENMSKNSHC